MSLLIVLVSPFNIRVICDGVISSLLANSLFEIPASTHNSAIISDGVLFESIPNISFISKI